MITLDNGSTIYREDSVIKINGINIKTTEPEVGDAVFIDSDDNTIFYKGGSNLNRTSLPSDLTFIGVVFDRKGNRVKILNKNFDTAKYCDVIQHTISAISSTSIVLKLRIRDTSKTGDAQYATNIDVPVTLTSTALDDTTAEEITAAIEAKCTEYGDTGAWWAYVNDGKIIIQRDTWVNYQQYIASATGCTIAQSTVWEDMKSASYYWKKSGERTNYRGMMNIGKTVSYWSINGRTPTANEPVSSPTLTRDANISPVTKTSFENSEYCTALREAYGDYTTYIKEDFGIMYPQKYSVFALTPVYKFETSTCITKTGSTKYKFPAMHAASLIGYGSGELSVGNWHLPTVLEGVEFMKDDTLSKINATRTAMNLSAMSTSSYYWFLLRCNVYRAWYYYGTNGTLYYHGVSGALSAGAVALKILDA